MVSLLPGIITASGIFAARRKALLPGIVRGTASFGIAAGGNASGQAEAVACAEGGQTTGYYILLVSRERGTVLMSYSRRYRYAPPRFCEKATGRYDAIDMSARLSMPLGRLGS